MDGFVLARPGVALFGMATINTPNYPFRHTDAKVGDKVWVIVEKHNPDDKLDVDIAIDTDTIADVSDYYKHKVESYEYRKKVLSGEVEWPTYEGEKVEITLGELPDPSTEKDYLIDFWLTKYSNGHGNCFGETIYSSFEEAKSVFVQYFVSDHKQYQEVLFASELDLKPE